MDQAVEQFSLKTVRDFQSLRAHDLSRSAFFRTLNRKGFTSRVHFAKNQCHTSSRKATNILHIMFTFVYYPQFAFYWLIIAYYVLIFYYLVVLLILVTNVQGLCLQ